MLRKTPILKTRQERKKQEQEERKEQRATILTSTLIKDCLVEKENKKKANEIEGCC